MKPKIFAANWKLNKSADAARDFLKLFLDRCQDLLLDNKEIVFFPQNFSLEAVSSILKSTQFGFGPQTVHFEKAGAYTGENSAEIAKAMNCQFVLLGHSERRQHFFESSESLSKKVKLVQSLSMTPVFCIGESLIERQNEKTAEICNQQIVAGLSQADRNLRLILAYEPIWAIGTGQVATTDQIKETHAFIYETLSEEGFKNFQILYGGSVKPENASSILNIANVDGFLVGGAALEVDSFLKICNAN